jgi:hypothetical protein
MKPFSLLVTLLAALFVSGCVYTHTVQPLTLDMHQTPVADYEKTGSIKHISFPVSGGTFDIAAWGSAAIGDVARQQGMKEVYFADLEIVRVLRIWNEYTIHVYGK